MRLQRTRHLILQFLPMAKNKASEPMTPEIKRVINIGECDFAQEYLRKLLPRHHGVYVQLESAAQLIQLCVITACERTHQVTILLRTSASLL